MMVVYRNLAYIIEALNPQILTRVLSVLLDTFNFLTNTISKTNSLVQTTIQCFLKNIKDGSISKERKNTKSVTFLKKVTKKVL